MGTMIELDPDRIRRRAIQQWMRAWTWSRGSTPRRVLLFVGLGLALYLAFVVVTAALSALLDVLPCVVGLVVVGLIVGGCTALFRLRQAVVTSRTERQRQWQADIAFREWYRREAALAELRFQEWQRRQEARRGRQTHTSTDAGREREHNSTTHGEVTLDDLLLLTPTDFERLIAKLLDAWGHTDVRHVGGSGDLGVDVASVGPHGERVIVQCKRYRAQHQVGSREIQTFIGMMTVEHKADQGIFVTTSAFSQQAQELAERHDIEVIDGPQLMQYIKSAYATD